MGRFTLADDEASADIILVFSKNGVQNTEKSDNKKDTPAARRATAPASHPVQQCARISKGTGRDRDRCPSGRTAAVA
jgi:hypothetical protein